MQFSTGQSAWQTGESAHRLYACAMLAAWGVPEGLRTIARWARDPDATPWARAPVTFERFAGADSAFELLADSIRIAGELDHRDATVDELRTDALRALLGSYHRVYVGRAVFVALDLDPALAASVRGELGPAVERAIAAAAAGAAFDLPHAGRVADRPARGDR